MKRSGSIVLIVLMVVLLFGAVNRFLHFRLDKGDVYPKSSSMRKDPLGSEVLFEALNALDQRRPVRNFRPFTSLDEGLPATWLFLGLSPYSLESPALRRHLDGLVQNGHRVVVTLAGGHEAPLDFESLWFEKEESDVDQDEGEGGINEENAGNSSPEDVVPQEPNSEEPFVDHNEPKIRPHWDWTLYFSSDLQETREKGDFVAQQSADLNSLPPTLPWRSAWAFPREVDDRWISLFQIGEDPVVIERTQGRGSIILMADSYLLSNEALSLHRESLFLSYLLGESERIVFDEVHLGTTQHQGVMTLVIRHGLQGFLFALGGVAALFLWWALFPFSPQGPELVPQETAVGLGSESTLLHLLEQTLPQERILELSMKSWSEEVQHRIPQEVLQQIDQLAKREPLEAYRAIADLLKDYPFLRNTGT